MPTQTEHRITELEIKITDLEYTVDQQNHCIFRQQQQIDFLIRELQGMQEQVRGLSSNEPRSLRDEIPPHY